MLFCVVLTLVMHDSLVLTLDMGDCVVLALAIQGIKLTVTQLDYSTAL